MPDADTPAKRVQITTLIAVGASGLYSALPIPDGSITQPDRQHLLGLYGGISAGAPSNITAPVSSVAFGDASPGAVAFGDASPGAVAFGDASPGAVAVQGAP
jgi:hypothetical protein